MLETMDVKRIKDLWHTMTRRKKVSSVSSKLTIRLDRTLLRFLQTKAFEFPFTDILMHVNLAVSYSGSTLDIPEEEHKEVQQTVKKVFEQRRSRRTITTTLGSLSSTAHDRFIGSDDGRVVVQVEPEQQTEGGLRRSTRRRHAIVYDS